MKIHHMGYLVKKIDRALSAFSDLGYTIQGEKVFDEYRQIEIVFMSKDGYLIELVSPASKESIVTGLLKRAGNSPYHICYETETFEKDLEELTEKKYVLCSEPCEAAAFGGRRVCFLIHPYIGMIELLEG